MKTVLILTFLLVACKAPKEVRFYPTKEIEIHILNKVFTCFEYQGKSDNFTFIRYYTKDNLQRIYLEGDYVVIVKNTDIDTTGLMISD